MTDTIIALSPDESPSDDAATRASLTGQLLQTAKAARDHADRRLARVDSSLIIWTMLSTLARDDEVSHRALARSCAIEGPTLTRYVDLLVAKGWVCRRRDNRDRRIVWVAFTEAGRDHYERLALEAVEIEAQVRSLLTDEEYELVMQALVKLEAITLATPDLATRPTIHLW